MTASAATTTVVAMPGWWSTISDAERQAAPRLADLDVVTACTHVVDGIALVTAAVTGTAPRLPGTQHRWALMAQDAVADHEAHYGGRLFVFPGQSELGGAMTAMELLERTIIDELVVPGHPWPIEGEARIEGLDFVRPVFRQGVVVLTLRPMGPGQFQPFEKRRTARVGRL
ncbi:hypothetical protein [Arsenicicoccus dermatophilus]|uniref:hypothetical protein n=1 Tax=Arsenicicoccus dermatophilus TaxID=1076331 RepID=UPI00391719AC